MKELSDKEKAKLYDKAIEYANYLINECCKEGTDGSFHRADLNKMFPELKESEDEEIRKWLIEMVEEVRKANPTNAAHNGNCSDAIAWLEKQDKQKPQSKSAFETLNEEKVDNSNFIKYANNVEPKFKVGDKIIEKDFNECGCGTIIDIKDGKYIFDDGGFICIEEQGLWQLVEQKSAWSEKDDYIFNNIYNFVKENLLDKNRSACASECLKFLKSLKDRYTWKPTDEQITYLSHAVNTAKYKNDISTNGYEPYIPLSTLLQQLKKLKE